MSGSEDEIWGYRSMRKKRAAGGNAEKSSHKASVEVKRKAAKRGGATRIPARAKSKKSPAQSGFLISPAEERYNAVPRPQDSPTPQTESPSTPRARHAGCCPSCQMPFSILLVQTPRWHVSECLDAPSSAQTECPDGLSCSSTIVSHYKRFSHFLLAQSKADGLSPYPAICLPSPDTRSQSCTSNGRGNAERCQGAGSSPAFANRTTNVKLSQSRSLAGSQGAGSSPAFINRSRNLKLLLASSQVAGSSPALGSHTTNVKLSRSQGAGSSPAFAGQTSEVKLSRFQGARRSPALKLSRSPARSRGAGRSPAFVGQTSEVKLSQSQDAGRSPVLQLSRSQDAGRSPALKLSQSQDAGRSPALKLSQSRSPASSQGSVKQTSLDAWLSTPTKPSPTSPDASQEISSHQAASRAALGLSQEDQEINVRPICYSPLVSDQELFSDEESLQPGPVRELFSNKSSPDALENIEEEFAASKHFITQSRIKPLTECNGDNNANPNSNTTAAIERGCVRRNGGSGVADRSIDGGNWSVCSTPESETSEWLSAQKEAECWTQKEAEQPLIPSANGHREAAPLRSSVAAAIEQKSFCARSFTQPVSTNRTHIKESFSQIPSGMPLGGAVPSKGMKQMDIGVFFGLQPKSKPVKVPLKSQSPNAGASQIEEKQQRKRKDGSSLWGVQSLTDITGGVPATAPSQRKRKAVGSLSDADSLTNNTNGVTAPSGTQRRGWKKSRQNSTAEEPKGRRQCPFYKKIPGTGFSVDAFQYGVIEGCSAYFLTHFHSDHYGGLTKKFRQPIYCSKITGNLVASKLRVETEFINTLPMDTECVVENVKVILLDANHCPGAVLLLFILPNGTTILHTGDFRADTSMERYPALIGRKIHTLYLDTTYCSPEYTFPPQQEAIQFAVNAAFEAMTLNPRTLVVCGTYSVGKEKVFLAIADVLGCKVCMSPDKWKTMQCLESDEIRPLVTTDWHSTALHVLPMMQVSFKGLGAHLNKFSGRYDRVLAFKPTGWTYSDGYSSMADIRPQIRGKITIYGIPYSEHSSYLEMKRFVQFTRPQKIIPTVNVGNCNARSAMEKYFAEWLSESRRR